MFIDLLGSQRPLSTTQSLAAAAPTPTPLPRLPLLPPHMPYPGTAVSTPRSVTPDVSIIVHDDATTVAEPHSETVSLTDQTNLLPRRKVMAVFFGLSLCILVSCLDSTIVATALPTISAFFNAGSVASWVPSSYFLTSTAFQPVCEYQ